MFSTAPNIAVQLDDEVAAAPVGAVSRGKHTIKKETDHLLSYILPWASQNTVFIRALLNLGHSAA